MVLERIKTALILVKLFDFPVDKKTGLRQKTRWNAQTFQQFLSTNTILTIPY
jgi:hypothetical protein